MPPPLRGLVTRAPGEQTTGVTAAAEATDAPTAAPVPLYRRTTAHSRVPCGFSELEDRELGDVLAVCRYWHIHIPHCTIVGTIVQGALLKKTRKHHDR